MLTFGSATLSLQGPGGRVKVEITGDRTTVGRTRDNECVLNDPAVSSHHCEFVTDRSGLVIRDLGSSNGTYVNGRRVKEAPVYDGDAIKIGQFQGRIVVRGLDDKPLRPPGVGGAAIGIGAAVVIVLAAGGGLLYVTQSRGAADRDTFAEYERRAKEFLASEPCSAIEAAIPKIKAIEARLEAPQLGAGKRGKLTAKEKEKNEALLSTSRKREPFAQEALRSVSQVVDRQQAALVALKGYSRQFNSDELKETVSQLESLFATRSVAGAEVAQAWKKHVGQLADYNELLERLVRTGDPEAANKLDGWRASVDATKLADECQVRFSKTQQEGLLKLAGVVF
jgi:hypothetical protein